jgi:hypothetical protein
MQESLKTELETLRLTISDLYSKNDLESISESEPAGDDEQGR